MDVLWPSRRSRGGGWRYCYATVTALRAVLVYHSHRSGGAALPQSQRFARCCYAAVTALRAVLLCHSHRITRCCYATVTALCAVLLCHSHRITRCCYATVIAPRGAGVPQTLRFARCCYAMPQSSLRAVLDLSLASVIAWCGTGSSIAGTGD